MSVPDFREKTTSPESVISFPRAGPDGNGSKQVVAAQTARLVAGFPSQQDTMNEVVLIAACCLGIAMLLNLAVLIP